MYQGLVRGYYFTIVHRIRHTKRGQQTLPAWLKEMSVRDDSAGNFQGGAQVSGIRATGSDVRRWHKPSGLLS